ncbi:MAG TPA: bifunctional salicylyl-CoA 5-hydroxylase/oxidoreductase [Gemmatimonadaceae bacterium]|nr:bifunctional salicylyl-CoA 5-hydroxylase/oxidoreductase [Gemmatimonadaceae bacterium]
MKIVTIGGGPAGLYFALLMRKARPDFEVTLLERNAADSTFGWGVVFSDQTLENFRAADEPTFREITDNFAHWDDIDVHFKGATVTSGGHGFSGIARRKLLEVLRRRAESLGVRAAFGREVRDPGADLAALGLGDAALVVAADGVNSVVRRAFADAFRPGVDVRPAKFVWLGTTRRFDAFTFIVVRDERTGGVYQAHAYRFDDRTSAFIVECDPESWRAAGFDAMDADATVAACERMFAPWLDGHPLLFNAEHLRRSPWVSFTVVRAERWHHDRYVLVGDAAHTAHFSIGSGTKLAMEDAISLARELSTLPDSALGARHSALEAYQQERQAESLRLQNAARNSMEWFENVRRYVGLEPQQFAYSLLTRSQRVSHENLRLRDARYLGGVERWFAARAGLVPTLAPAALLRDDTARQNVTPQERGDSRASVGASPEAPPPMFTPFALRGMALENRVVVSPMDMYCAEGGTPNDFHLAHLTARALGGAALVMTEMTCVSPEARITLGCTGMYRDEHLAAWRRVVEAVHRWSPAKICLQLGHSGGKGSTKLMWEGMDEPLDDGNWECVAASAVCYKPGMRLPREMTRADMDAVREQFVRATRMAVEAGFDMLELHCAHGYLLSGFITPVLNRRGDEYGGPLEHRLRYPVEVFMAMRAAWPADRPMSVRISATDWVEEGGLAPGEEVEVARAFHRAGADIIHVSTGQTAADARPRYGRMFQTPFSDRIRNEAGIPTIAVGNITDADQVNSIIAAGRADLCAIGRPHLSDPHWTLHAAAQLGYGAQWWPVQYRMGKQQLERLVKREGGWGMGDAGPRDPSLRSGQALSGSSSPIPHPPSLAR